MDKQEKFILDTLTRYPVCEIKEKYITKLKDVSTPVVKNILSQKFINGTDMKAVLCLFDTLLLSSTKKGIKKRGIYNLTKKVQKWITTMEKSQISSQQAYIYFTDILSKDIQIVMKVPRDSDMYEDMIREYFIGITSVNGLRYQIPNFAYTLGDRDWETICISFDNISVKYI